MLCPKDKPEIEAYYDKSKACWRVDLAESFFDNSKELAEERAWDKLHFYRQCGKENEKLKERLDDYALLEECSPPDWPRKDFVKHLFDLWEK